MKNEMDIFFDGVDDATIRRERSKARELRKTNWWKNKLAQGVCYYCNQKFKPKELTMDHIIPLARGGQSSKSNLVTTCKSCNNKKKSMLPVEWEEYMKNLDQR